MCGFAAAGAIAGVAGAGAGIAGGIIGGRARRKAAKQEARILRAQAKENRAAAVRVRRAGRKAAQRVFVRGAQARGVIDQSAASSGVSVESGVVAVFQEEAARNIREGVGDILAEASANAKQLEHAAKMNELGARSAIQAGQTSAVASFLGGGAAAVGALSSGVQTWMSGRQYAAGGSTSFTPYTPSSSPFSFDPTPGNVFDTSLFRPSRGGFN